ncbi:MAG: hypothetical protein WCX84_02910 [Syntrophales bacterium]|jgi:type I restriction enzyme S subunit
MSRPATQRKRATYPAYKQSGVEWLGKVPKHWELMKIKFHSHLYNGYAFDSNSYVPTGIPIIRIGDVGKPIDWENVKRVSDDMLPKPNWP